MDDARQTLTTERDTAGILTITLNRPDKLNALNQQVISDLGNCLTTAKKDAAVKAVIITGAGEKAFCAGADINEIAQCNADSANKFARHGQVVFNQLEHLGKPSVAAVNGFAFGGGCELAMAASLRIAADTAQFGQPEVKLGVIPAYGGTQRLARLVGKGRAIDLCISGRFIDATTAQSWGLVTAISKPKSLLNDCKKYLEQVLKASPNAVMEALEAIHQGFDLSLSDALALEAKYFAACFQSSQAAEGLAAFLEKRTPDWTV